ncbi:peptidoglycan D,D-transpeptidase FtsI family protein [Thauera linaloolentis]|uniref:Peptidoglycan D,D-transpeptidase FtsI n=1 Tax=Thauera linaloolentis (strain DSM 12138 / JCM 21573 / CCUG 41526 / CIP 105981 / IAM 15112 / NBRC 102519 / 47Lol) TaxID=1123367 RepID=N6XVE4_THAL4|nr:penicillin-binding protein 2 [Thauera linaloolentis]ENO85741.1 peptidoglycan glycosyltransferase [Thauera linaloolentis 47Lol = DSM 12138]MCM8564181.1 penicillin-binding protein 2 [Thauera linaloolentis]
MKKNQRTVTFNHNPLLKRELPMWRPRFVLLALLAGSMTLTGRALYLQGVNNDFLQAKGESRYARTIEIPATRGRITDRHGDMLAVSTPVRSVWALPADAKLEPAQARELARMLEMDVRELNEKLAVQRDFVYLKRQLSPEVAQRIADLELPGIHQQREFRRYYPGGEVMAHILGFTNVEDRGQEGIELAFEKQLAGAPGLRRVIKDRRGQIIEGDAVVRPPREGEEVALSIDGKIQYLAWSALRDAMQQHKAKAGAAVVIDSRTGEILALANAPTFNPNNRRNLTGEQLRNRVFTDSFEPGSVMKPFIAGLALDRGKVKPTTLIDASAGRMTIGTATISDSHRHDKPMTVNEVIQKSSNIGTVKLAQYFSPTEMWQLFDDLGFGKPLNLGFPGESGGRLRPAKAWKPIEQATMSYGHGISVSLIQMARAYLAFARDGELVPLSLTRVDGVPSNGRRIFSPETTRAVRAMLESVTQPGGTATKAQVAGYRVGGKTGTALKIENGRYVKRYIASFVGFAPVSNPRLVVAVMIDEPSAGSYYAGTVVGPLFSRIMEGSLRSLGVAPDAPLTPLQLARRQAEEDGAASALRESM